MAIQLRALLVLAVCMLLNVPASAKTSLFDRMGGEPVLKAAVDRFTEIIIADDRINFTFAESDLGKFKLLLYQQLCELSGGPCHYTGRDMATAHAKLGINTSEFDALAEDLYLALGRVGVPYRLQNRLMALLAPMKRDIVRHGRPTENAAGESRRDQ